MSGFIVMHREALDHPLLQDGERFRAWFWMVARACWKPTPFDVAGRIILLERGQFCASRQLLADAWNWSPSAVERFLTRLQTEQMIGRETGQGRSVITICNYAKYQNVGDITGQATGQRSDSDRTAKEQGNKGTIEGGMPPTPKSPPKPKRAVAEDHPLPDDWQPALGPKTEVLVARWPKGMLEREELRFRAHAERHERLAKNWNAAFGTWLSKADERIDNNGASYGHSAGYPPRDNRDGFAAAIDDRLEELAEQPSPQAGRYDTDPGGDDRVVPIAAARSL
jgi:hypothetical protein